MIASADTAAKYKAKKVNTCANTFQNPIITSAICWFYIFCANKDAFILVWPQLGFGHISLPMEVLLLKSKELDFPKILVMNLYLIFIY